MLTDSLIIAELEIAINLNECSLFKDVHFARFLAVYSLFYIQNLNKSLVFYAVKRTNVA